MLRAAGARFVTHPGVAGLYREYLAVSHFVVRASVPLMEAAVGRARAMGDRAAALMVPFLERHIAEEAGHDDWLLDDLRALGADVDAVVRRTPPAEVAALVGAQYYWVLHHHPAALLGYMAVLEGGAPSPEQVEELVARTGHPRQAFRTLAEHAALDADHAQEVFGVIDQLTGDRAAAAIGLSAMHTVVGLATVVDGIVERGPGPPDGHP